MLIGLIFLNGAFDIGMCLPHRCVCLEMSAVSINVLHYTLSLKLFFVLVYVVYMLTDIFWSWKKNWNFSK